MGDESGFALALFSGFSYRSLTGTERDFLQVFENRSAHAMCLVLSGSTWPVGTAQAKDRSHGGRVHCALTAFFMESSV